MAKQHREIEVDRDVIRLTRFGFDNCEKYDLHSKGTSNTNRASCLYHHTMLSIPRLLTV